MFFSLRILPWVIVISAFCLSLWMGSRTAWVALTEHPAFAVRPENVHYEAPEYVQDEQMGAYLRAHLSEVLEGRHVFERDLAADAARRLDEAPWIVHVNKVTKLLPGELRLCLRFRKPSGIVKFANQYYLIDRYGYMLPDDLYSELPAWAEKPRVPVIVHRALPRHFPARGRQWEGKALPAGARLNRFLLRSGILDFLDIKKIDVSRVGRRRRDWEEADISLVAANGAVVGWGTTDEYENINGLNRRVDEPSDREKLQELAAFLREYPELEGVRHLDLRFNKIMSEF